VTADQLAVDEKVIRINGDDYWLYGAVDPETNKYCKSGCFRRQQNRRRDGF
jgi:transposase-like protein